MGPTDEGWGDGDELLETGFMELRQLAGPRQEGESPMVAALRAAGHDGANEDDLQYSWTAFHAAFVLREEMLRIVGPTRKAATGRNAPCPCGSGKKHKKCCLGKAEDGDQLLSYLRRELPWEMIPRPIEDDIGRDLERLEELLDEDPELAGVRFDHDVLEEFLTERLPEDLDALEQEDRSGLGEELLREYLGAHNELSIFTAFQKAAARCGAERRDLDDLRALATGCIYALIEQASNGEAATPLAMMLFQLTLTDDLEDDEEIDAAFRAVLEEQLRPLLELDPGEDGARVPDDLDEGLLFFPIPLPCVPGVFVYLMTDEGMDDWDDELLLNLVREAAEAGGPEDDRLMVALLDEDLESVPIEEATALTRLRDLAAGPGIPRSVWANLMLETFSLRYQARIPWAEEILAERELVLDISFLEQYAQALTDRGFPVQAERLLECRDLL